MELTKDKMENKKETRCELCDKPLTEEDIKRCNKWKIKPKSYICLDCEIELNKMMDGFPWG